MPDAGRLKGRKAGRPFLRTRTGGASAGRRLSVPGPFWGFWAVALGLLLLAAPSTFGAGPPPLRWTGRVELTGPFTVEPSQTLVVEAGTQVVVGSQGTVLVRGKAYLFGTREAPVRIAGTREPKAPVFQVNDPEAVPRFHRVQAEGAGTVVGATAGTVVVTDSEFRRNATGLRLQMRTRSVLRNVTFEENDLGLTADNGALARVVGTTFRKTKRGSAPETPCV